MPARVWLCSAPPPWKGNGPPRYTFTFQAQTWPWNCIGYCHPPCPPIPVSREALQLAFEVEVEMHALADIIISGWPNDIKEVPHLLCPYWQHCESLTVEDRLVFHGEALIIPPSEREKVLGTLHQSHQGITKTHLLACGSVFWPGINKTIEEAVWQCETCMRFQAKNAATPLTPTPTPPQQICASYIFTLDGMDYLILANFYSKVILVCYLLSKQTVYEVCFKFSYHIG